MVKPKKPVSLADLFALSGAGQTGGREQLAMPSLALDMPATLPEPAVPAVNQENVAQVAETQDALASPLTFKDPFAGSSLATQAKALVAKPSDPRQDYFKEIEENQKKEQTKNSLTENRYLSPEEYARLEEQAMGVNPDTGAVNANSPYQLQKKGINDTNEMLRVYAENSPVQTDLSPLAALVDQWTGSKLAPSYKTPTPYPEVFKSVLGAQKGLQDDRASMAKEIQGAIRGMKSGYSTDSLTSEALAKMLLTQGMDKLPAPKAAGGRDASSKMGQAVTLARRTPGYDKIQEQVLGASNLLSAVHGKSWIGDRMAISSLLESAGLKPISDLDVGMFSGNPAAMAALARLKAKYIDGSYFTEKDRADLITFAEGVIRIKDKALRDSTREIADQMGTAMGVDPYKLHDVLLSGVNIGSNIRNNVRSDKAPKEKAPLAEKPAEKKITLYKGGTTYQVSESNYAKWTPAQKAQYRSK